MCLFTEELMSDGKPADAGKAPEGKPRDTRTRFAFGTSDPGLQERFRAVFLDRIGAHAGVILRKPVDGRLWRFTRYTIDLSPAGWAHVHVPATCVMFQYTDRLRELLTLLRQPVLDPRRLTGILILTRTYRVPPDPWDTVRWMRLGDWNGTEELLVYGLSDRRDLRSGYLAVMTPEERGKLVRMLARCLAALEGP